MRARRAVPRQAGVELPDPGPCFLRQRRSASFPTASDPSTRVRERSFSRCAEHKPIQTPHSSPRTTIRGVAVRREPRCGVRLVRSDRPNPSEARSVIARQKSRDRFLNRHRRARKTRPTTGRVTATQPSAFRRLYLARPSEALPVQRDSNRGNDRCMIAAIPMPPRQHHTQLPCPTLAGPSHAEPLRPQLSTPLVQVAPSQRPLRSTCTLPSPRVMSMLPV